MPIYEYECEACQYLFEELQSLKDESLSECPRCGGHVHRLISPGAGLIFKGSGFYITDYARKGKADAPDADKAPSSPTDKNSKTEAPRDSTKEKSSQSDKKT